MSNTLSADLLRGLFDSLPPSERDCFLAALPGATATQPPPKLLTIGETASRFGCTARTVQRWIHDGELPAIRRGRLVRIPEPALYSTNPLNEEKR